ncbi:MAG: hypothetical protein M0P73_13640 [Syntrophobacterales bacterium]|jgi:hypothetical protein|nr:hypothetical protein [Syntrophobacterales bacterium]
MTTQRRQLWVALVVLAVGATMLHFRIHPPKDLTYLWPNLFSVIDLVVVSALFLFRRTALAGLLLNSFLAYLGIIMMADFSLAATLAGQVKVMPGQDFFGWLLLTTFPDIMVLTADFCIGLALYRAILAEK